MRLLITCLAIIYCHSLLPAQENWSGYRGPNGDGHTTSTKLPVKFSDTENVIWKTPIPGRGWSSPVIWGDQIWMTYSVENGRPRHAVCVDKNSGKLIHDVRVFLVDQPQYIDPSNSYASPTPVIEQDRVYVHFGSAGTACLDTNSGKPIWKRDDMKCNHWRGAGSSPILYDDLLILTFDGYDFQYVIALNKKTGETVWKQNRDIPYKNNNGDFKKAYSTPTVVKYDNRIALVSPSAIATIAYEPLTGKELWRVEYGGMNSACRPVLSGDLLYLSTANAKNQLIAVTPKGLGDLTATQIKWKTNKGVSLRGTPSVMEGLLYMANDTGVATCLDAETGELVWQNRIGGSYWASPMTAPGRVYFCSKGNRTEEAGKVVIVKAGREFELLAENTFPAGIWASPAVSDDALFIRTKTHIYRIEDQ